jgi:hypothetical protein
MRTPDRDQRRSALTALCTALVILLVLILPAGALSADYSVFPNGTAYRAIIGINDTERYAFTDMGSLGEDVPLAAGDVQLTRGDQPVAFNWSRPWGAPASISFAKGNYTVSFIAPLRDNNLKAVFLKPYNVNVTLPQELDVQNPLLAGMSNGANVTRSADNITTIRWSKTYTFDLRFYTQGQKDLLFFFLQFMGILIVVLVVIPYVLSMRNEE